MNGFVLTDDLVAKSERLEPDPGPDLSEQYLSEEDYCAVAEALSTELGNRPLWIFAYDSLIWNPAF